MKIKTFLIMVLSLMSFTVYAQNGGIKGQVVSRTTRTAINNVKVTLTPGNITTKTDATGNFEVENLAKGEYSVTFESNEYEALTLSVRVNKIIKDLNKVVLVSAKVTPIIDDAIFAEFDTETLDDAQSIPSSLSASKDVFNNIASYKFSEMRFNVRGYNSQYSDVYMNGIQLNDAMTGYTPWSLWSGLNDATRNQEITSSLNMGDVGIGGIGGTTNINTRPSQMRKGLRASVVNANSMYRFRGMVTYSSGQQDNGWSYAFSLSTRQGGNSYVDGIYYNAYGYFAAVEKQINLRQRIALTLLGVPTQRGVQQASTQEAYDLVGNNYYNPNWGWQSGKRRNARVKNYHEPIAMLNYTFDINDRTQLNIASSFRFGKNGYSALTWYGGPDPRPDYYRYLPSFYQGTETGAWLDEAWRANTNNIRHINWDQLYEINRNQPNESSIYGAGHRAINMIEERHADQLDWNLYAQFSHTFKDNSQIKGGANFRRNRTQYYSEVKDLLGGDYWIDVDKFAERDMGSTKPELYQNNMDYYQENGYAHAAKKGDKYSYNYYGNVLSARGWGEYTTNLGNLGIKIGGELGHNTLWRHGIWKKGLFEDNSQGNSAKQNYLTYKVKGNFSYTFSAAHTVEANIVYMQDAPSFRSAFVSPRTRNSATPGISTEKVFGIDASYKLHIGDIKARVSGYYTKLMNQNKVLSYYNDVEATFSNFAMSGIDKRHFGLEAAASVPVYGGISINGAVSWGQYTYDSNPDYIQIQDNSGVVKNQGKVYWKNFRVESTPQTAINLGLSYRGQNNVYASVDMNYYNNMYLSMSPLYRTDAVLSQGMTADDMRELRSQEKFSSAHVLNASIGKNWYINRTYTIGFNLNVRNILNDQDIKTGGYEQVRLLKNKDANYQSYQPFDSKYFYMFGTTYYMNLYFRF
ncbi:TonB-dependent receptor [uncultured Bacteroides sp.]|uniref:TonB-dependent receptor n=1 Tax=uncultured Bacteroides sp. TaxID=162156 RepID=UPI002AAB6FFF|nr:TonB-dependent receptor [uncultured Bacteroides sp.]